MQLPSLEPHYTYVMPPSYAISRLLCYVTITERHSDLLHLATTLCYLISHKVLLNLSVESFQITFILDILQPR